MLSACAWPGLNICPCACPALQTGSKDVNKVDALFNAYKKKSQHSEGEDVMGPEGARGAVCGGGE